MTRVLVNSCFGGFGFSDFVLKEFNKRTGDSCEGNEERYRTHEVIIDIFEEFGSEKCSGNYAKLKLIEIPDDVDYEITEYDGMEKVEECHRSWS